MHRTKSRTALEEEYGGDIACKRCYWKHPDTESCKYHRIFTVSPEFGWCVNFIPDDHHESLDAILGLR
jgi:hypothetical protein